VHRCAELGILVHVDHKEQVGEWIRLRRDALGIPPGRLAEIVGVSYRTVMSTEAGDSQPRSGWARWEDALFWERGSLTRAYKHGVPPVEIQPGSPGATAEDLLGIPDMTPEEARAARAFIETLRRQAAEVGQSQSDPQPRRPAAAG
jgi:hypothetical protein